MITTETADQISEELAQNLKDEGRDECREHLGRYLQEMSRRAIIECLTGSPLEGTDVDDQFLKGFALAAELVRDQTWDY